MKTNSATSSRQRRECAWRIFFAGLAAGAFALCAGCGQVDRSEAPPESAAPLSVDESSPAGMTAGAAPSSSAKDLGAALEAVRKEEMKKRMALEEAEEELAGGRSPAPLKKLAAPKPAPIVSMPEPVAQGAPPLVPMPGEPVTTAVPPAPAPAEKDFHVVEVFYATDRQPEKDAKQNMWYGKDRNRQGPVEYGRTEVSIPLSHTMGIIERPVWYKLEFSEDPKKHVMVLKLEKMAADPFFARVKSTAGEKPLNEGLLFIHGFNVPFDQAIRRTAQMSYDLAFGGVALTYSWPSQGVVTGYTVDEENVQWAIPHLAKFLVDLQEKTKLTKIHVIAHSMGTRLLTNALAQARDANFKLKLNNVILAAPDIDADVFKEQILPKIRGSAERLTMYASSGDAALKASQEIHGNDRLGLSGSNLTVLEGMDTVDASQIDTSLLGHNYYGSQKVVMEDILGLIIRGLEPPQRKLVLGKIGEWDFKDLLSVVPGQ